MTRSLEIEDIGFSIKTEMILKRHTILKLAELLDISAGNLRRLSGCSPSVILDIRKKLAFHGLSIFGDTLVTSDSATILIRDIPQSLESICESIRQLNQVLDETRHRIKDLEDNLSKIIANEQYKNG
jgi:hypothetical protein